MHETTHDCTAYRWLWQLLVVVTVCIASGNTIEAPFMPPTLIPKDKVAHFAVFGLIATLIYRALLHHRTGSGTQDDSPVSEHSGENAHDKGSHATKRLLSTNLCGLIAIGVTAAFGISDEIHQRFTPGRMFDLYDFAADALGAVVAVCAYRWLPFYRNALEYRFARFRCAKKQTKQDTTVASTSA